MQGHFVPSRAKFYIFQIFCSCSLKYSLIFGILSFDRSLSKENQSYSVLVKKYWKAIRVHIEKDLFLYLVFAQFKIFNSQFQPQSRAGGDTTDSMSFHSSALSTFNHPSFLHSCSFNVQIFSEAKC